MTEAAAFVKILNHRRAKVHHGLLLFLGAAAASWLIYVVSASTVADNRLRAAASRLDLTLQHFELRSWFPGQLVLRNMVVTHEFLGGNCRTTIASVDLPHDPLRLLMGDLRISTLTANGFRSSCEPGPRAQTMAPGTASPVMLGMIGITGLAAGTADAPPTETSAIDARSAEHAVEIERAVVHVKGVSYGRATVVEPFELTAEGFAVAHDGTRLHRAEAKLESGTVTYDERTVLDNLSVSLRFSSVPVGPESGVGDELHATLEIKRANVRSLPGIGTEAATAVEGTLQANLAWRAAHLAGGSSLRLSLEPFTWRHQGGGVTQLDKASVVSAAVAGLAESRPTSVEWRVQLPSVRYHGEPGLSVTAHDVALWVRYETPAMLPFDEPGDFSLRSGGVSLSRGEQVLMADGVSIEGRLRGAARSPEDQVFDFAMLTLTGARLGGELPVDEETVDARFSAEVQWEARQAAEGYSGSVNMRGQDAGVILNLVSGDELPSWITSKFYGEPFSLEAAVELRNGIVRVSDLELERGALTLRGWWRLDPEPSDGALLMEYGGLMVGIGGGQPGRVMLRASQEWLQSRPPPKLLSPVVEP